MSIHRPKTPDETTQEQSLENSDSKMEHSSNDQTHDELKKQIKIKQQIIESQKQLILNFTKTKDFYKSNVGKNKNNYFQSIRKILDEIENQN